MKILVIGGTGTLGQAVIREFGADHEIITAGKNRGDFQVDITDENSVKTLFRSTGNVDAIIATTGSLHFGPLTEMTAEQFNSGLQDKLLGQVRIALIGQSFLNDGGSITLTSGIIADEPIRQGANATTVNAAVEGFVRGAAIELPRGIRINVVSPTVVEESLKAYGPFFPGFEAAPAARVAKAYRRSVEGAQTGRVYKVW
ncbi:short chain dehydrogenase [Rahnella victoriana]|jgi:NAD(P)-dependent dehydrogenase (short-subunit alcohol dehydrogenase family)|uniref:short chain dehydrogenase n=1 Tax=Rahnella victoriana TaxID=1510570 RepID=UPI000BB1C20A|nr:short chain dehydrogenase [Rahnella victoriana]PBI81140.1 short chain dehydrogenase [Rahnella victoriana]UHM92212.1 short chain dehydrogenase [Rahnella victoriana]VTQ56380.1 short chain dehydrogenase [Campylobacter jejuni]